MRYATICGVRVPDPALKRRLNTNPAMIGTIGSRVSRGMFQLVRVLDDDTVVPLTGYETAETLDNIMTDMIETGWC